MIRAAIASWAFLGSNSKLLTQNPVAPPQSAVAYPPVRGCIYPLPREPPPLSEGAIPPVRGCICPFPNAESPLPREPPLLSEGAIPPVRGCVYPFPNAERSFPRGPPLPPEGVAPPPISIVSFCCWGRHGLGGRVVAAVLVARSAQDVQVQLRCADGVILECIPCRPGQPLH